MKYINSYVYFNLKYIQVRNIVIHLIYEGRGGGGEVVLMVIIKETVFLLKRPRFIKETVFLLKRLCSY